MAYPVVRVWKQTSGRLDERKDGTDDDSDDDDDTDNHNDADNDDVPPSPLETDGPWATWSSDARETKKSEPSLPFSFLSPLRFHTSSRLFTAFRAFRAFGASGVSKARAHPTPHTPRKSMQLGNLRRIVLRFRPQDRSAREFLARVVCQRATNPDCEIDIQLHDGAPSVEVEFDTKEVVRLETEGMTAGDIVRLVSNKSKEREVMETFQRAGWRKEMAVVGGPAGGKWNYAGVGVRIPRR